MNEPQKIKPPIAVYYDAAKDLFIDAADDCAKDNDFQMRWRHRKALFPQSRKAALEAFVAASPTPEEVEHALRYSRPFAMPEQLKGEKE